MFSDKQGPRGDRGALAAGRRTARWAALRDDRCTLAPGRRAVDEPGRAVIGAPWRRDADVVVVGSGAAGISAALTAAASGASVLVITKDLAGGASPLAQGGLAAAIGPGDTASAHARDTEIAGAGLCEPDAVAALAAGSPDAVEWLITLGARLERRALRLEGGHGARRVVHSGDDATGAEVHRTLLRALTDSRAEILDRTIALDLLTGVSPALSVPLAPGSPRGANFPPRGLDAPLASIEGSRCGIEYVRMGADTTSSPGSGVRGLMVASIGVDGALSPGVITARAVILAAGGLGQAYATTSNPPGATGDALAMAFRAGAVLRDPEFVQFHPTVLYLDGVAGQRPLITEALRGAGAVLRDLDGKPVMAGHDPRGDLAPRDIVAARVHSVIAAVSGDHAGVPGDRSGVSGDRSGVSGNRAGVSGDRAGGGPGHVWLDATALGADVLENGFPTVTAACRKHDIDPVTDLIPIAPGAHYACGGIRAGLDGRTSVPGLYAVGEAASTGVHGANRLASNSLVEAIIAGRRAGISASREISGRAEAVGPGAGVADPGAEAAYPGAEAAYAGAGAAYPSQEGTGCHVGPFRNALDVTLPPFYGAGRHIESPWGEGALGGASPWGEAGTRREDPTRRVLAEAMSRYAGVLRDAAGLERLLRIIEDAGPPAEAESSPIEGGRGRLPAPSRTGWERLRPPKSGMDATATPFGGRVDGAAIAFRLADVETLTLDDVETANLRTVSGLIASAALRRAESRGAHRRSDAPETAPTARHTLARRTPADGKPARGDTARDSTAHDNSARGNTAHDNHRRIPFDREEL